MKKKSSLVILLIAVGMISIILFVNMNTVPVGIPGPISQPPTPILQCSDGFYAENGQCLPYNIPPPTPISSINCDPTHSPNLQYGVCVGYLKVPSYPSDASSNSALVSDNFQLRIGSVGTQSASFQQNLFLKYQDGSMGWVQTGFYLDPSEPDHIIAFINNWAPWPVPALGDHLTAKYLDLPLKWRNLANTNIPIEVVVTSYVRNDGCLVQSVSSPTVGPSGPVLKYSSNCGISKFVGSDADAKYYSSTIIGVSGNKSCFGDQVTSCPLGWSITGKDSLYIGRNGIFLTPILQPLSRANSGSAEWASDISFSKTYDGFEFRVPMSGSSGPIVGYSIPFS